jgi:OmcA/MtrC family decaheme c-type cytochrome
MFAMTKAIRAQALAGAVLSLLAGVLLAGCGGGSTGAAGGAGPAGGSGSTGPGGSPLAHSIALATTIKAQITGVSGNNSLTINFNVVDQKGQPAYGLQPNQVRFAIAKLVSGDNGAASTWQSYINTVEQPVTGQGWGTVATRQATAEVASTAGGTFKDNGDGTYSYTLSKSLDAYTPADAQGPAVAYEPALTHRVGLEIRGAGANNAVNGFNNGVYTWLPSTGANTNLVSRDISGNQECDACHAQLGMHGGARNDVQYCVICHNPGTTDAQSGNTLDFKVMIHKIHAGSSLPSVQAYLTANPGTKAADVLAPGVGFAIWGYGGSVNNFSGVVWPQDTRNCATCHNAADPLTPDANNFQNNPTAAGCGGCHDDINFTTGAGHGPTNQPTTDADCTTCHGPAATVAQGDWQVVPSHVIPTLVLQKQFKLTVVRVEAVADAAGTTAGATPCAAGVAGCKVNPGEYLKVTVRVTNPTDGSTYGLLDAPFASYFYATPASTTATTARIRARIAYSTLNYTNPGANTGTSATQAQAIDFLPATQAAPKNQNGLPYTFAPPAQNSDGTYTLISSKPIPASYASIVNGGSGAVSMEGRAIMNIAKADDPPSYATIAIKSAEPVYFPITDAKAVARRDVVDTANCLRCHKTFAFHGGARSDNVKLCIMCHNPAQAVRTGTDGSTGTEPVDFKFFIHGIHSATYKYGTLDFTDVGFPGVLNNCLGCHKKDTYYPVDQTQVAATSIDAGASSSTLLSGYDNPAQHVAITANAGACGSCHVDKTAQTHMKQNGAIVITDQFPAGLQYMAQNVLSGAPLYIKDAKGMTKPQYQTETCDVCHGPGTTADTKVVHQVDSFKFN